MEKASTFPEHPPHARHCQDIQPRIGLTPSPWPRSQRRPLWIGKEAEVLRAGATCLRALAAARAGPASRVGDPQISAPIQGSGQRTPWQEPPFPLPSILLDWVSLCGGLLLSPDSLCKQGPSMTPLGSPWRARCTSQGWRSSDCSLLSCRCPFP